MIARLLIQFLVVLFACAPQGALAAFPDKPITLVVPFAAGGGTDFLGRVLASKLSDRLGQSVIVENRGGAGSMVGANYVARSTPDGYTLLVVTNSTIAAVPVLYKQSTINPLQDFVPLAMVSGSPFFLVANNKYHFKSLQDFIDLAKKRPKELTYSSAGVGSTGHIFMEMLMKQAGIQLTHVPYKGSAQAITDVMAGFVDVSLIDPMVATTTQQSDQVTYLGISVPERHPALPQLKPLSEQGLPNYNALAWVAVVAPAGIPSDVREKLRTELTQIVDSPEFREQLARNGSVPPTVEGADATTKFFKSEIQTWGDVIRDAGIAGTQ